MDFDAAISKLERNHSQMRKESRNKAASKERLQRQAAQRRKMEEERKRREKLQQKKLHFAKQYMDHWDNSANDSSSFRWQLQPTSIHGEGDKIALPPSVLEKLVQSNIGDSSEQEGMSSDVSFGPNKPLTFRIGILNPNYKPDNGFPLSSSLKLLMEEYVPPDHDHTRDGEPPSPMDVDGGNKNEEDQDMKSDAFLDEMKEKYLSYTYCTVVEFTQDDDHIGLPRSVAQKLLLGQNLSKKAVASGDSESEGQASSSYIVPSKRTTDPTTLPGYVKPVAPQKASKFEKGDLAHHTKKDLIVKVTKVHLDDELVPYYDVQTLDGSQEIQTTDDRLEPLSYGHLNSGGNNGNDDNQDDTPGHMSYGAFDVPDVRLELALVTKPLPKGQACTIVPTLQALKQGWNDIPDIKVALEQSIIRTRATLCVNDTLTCWHKGRAFDLTVSQVTPDTYGAVSCINTDIEVDIDYPNLPKPDEVMEDSKPCNRTASSSEGVSNAPVASTGYTLSGSLRESQPLPTSAKSSPSTGQTAVAQQYIDRLMSKLPDEPATTVPSETIATVLVRAPAPTQFSAQRRFDTSKATLRDVFEFTMAQIMSSGGGDTSTYIHSLGDSEMSPSFQLVTRFPRQVFQLSDSDKTLNDVGLQNGKHLLLVEKL